MDLLHGQAYTFLMTFAFPLQSGFRLWSRVSSVMGAKGGKNAKSSFFLSHSALSLFLLVFFTLLHSFFGHAREHESAKKRWCPPLNYTQR
jgi:hypothetical protein